MYLSDRRATQGVIETLIQLRKNGYKIGVVTNGQTKAQREKMKDIGVIKLVDTIFTSEQIGHPKPSKHIFQAALDALGANPNSSVMVGDDVKSDIEGALAHGIEAILYDPVSEENTIQIMGSTVQVIRYIKTLLNYLNIG